MLIFGYRTIKNVKKLHQQVRSSTSQNLVIKRKDQQMMMMLLVQIILFFICITPSALSKTYTALTLNLSKDSLDLTKENFLFQVSILILYIHCSSAFYIYTLTGRIFRRELKRLIPNLHQRNSTTVSEVVVIQQNQISIAYQLHQITLTRKNTKNSL